jgi:hypothetical protein
MESCPTLGEKGRGKHRSSQRLAKTKKQNIFYVVQLLILTLLGSHSIVFYAHRGNNSRDDSSRDNSNDACKIFTRFHHKQLVCFPRFKSQWLLHNYIKKLASFNLLELCQPCHVLIMASVALLSWLPIFQQIQTRALFNEGLSRASRVQISRILTGKIMYTI